MSLINCPECGKEISDKAKACPHCGLPSRYFIANAKQKQKKVSQVEDDTPKRKGISYKGGFCERYRVPLNDNCTGCGAGPLHYHELGCTHERCPICYEGLATCPHRRLFEKEITWESTYASPPTKPTKKEQRFEFNTSKLLGTFNGKNVYEGGRCPLCNAGHIILDGTFIRCSNGMCSWSQERINKNAEESSAPSPGLCPVCGTGRLVVLSMAPYMVRCSNPKCLNR